MKLEHVVIDWLNAEAPPHAPGRALNAALERVAVTPQDRSLWRRRPRSFLRGSSRPLLALAATLVALSLLGALAILGGSSRPPQASVIYHSARMEVAGTNAKGAGPVLQVTAELPANWQEGQWAAHRGNIGPPEGMSFFASVVDNTFSDPCVHIERNPKVGPTVDDFALALREIPHTTSTPPVEMVVAGLQATYIELTIASSLPCAAERFYLWQDSPGQWWWALGTHERLQIWIVEFGGQRVVIAARSYPGTSDEARAELTAILDSFVLGPVNPPPGGRGLNLPVPSGSH